MSWKLFFFPSLLGTAPGTVSPVPVNESEFLLKSNLNISRLLSIFHSLINNVYFSLATAVPTRLTPSKFI